MRLTASPSVCSAGLAGVNARTSNPKYLPSCRSAELAPEWAMAAATTALSLAALVVRV